MDDECLTRLVPSPSLEICNSPIPNTAGRAPDEPEGRDERDAGFLPHTCTGVRRLRTGSGTARRHRTPAPGPLLGTGSLVSEVHCPDTSPDLSCQKNKPTIVLFLATKKPFSTRMLSRVRLESDARHSPRIPRRQSQVSSTPLQHVRTS